MSIYDAMAQVDDSCAGYLNAVPEEPRASARNLLQYLALRRHDLRRPQALLASQGLSSLGRMESHVRSGLERVLNILHVLNGTEWAPALDRAPGPHGLRPSCKSGFLSDRKPDTPRSALHRFSNRPVFSRRRMR